jgi:chromosome segregation ATPase
LQTTCLTLNNKVSITDDLQRENDMLKRRLEESENIRNIQKEEIAEYERNRQEYERTRLQQKKENNALAAENSSLRRDIQDLLKDKSRIQSELDQATDYIITMEEKVYKSNKISLELLKQLKDAEVEIQSLQQYIVDLKQRIAVYIPMKDDAIDKKLAEYINNYPERAKLKIMFMRESEGVYQFGSKRVAVKVEK